MLLPAGVFPGSSGSSTFDGRREHTPYVACNIIGKKTKDTNQMQPIPKQAKGRWTAVPGDGEDHPGIAQHGGERRGWGSGAIRRGRIPFQFHPASVIVDTMILPQPDQGGDDDDGEKIQPDAEDRHEPNVRISPPIRGKIVQRFRARDRLPKKTRRMTHRNVIAMTQGPSAAMIQRISAKMGISPTGPSTPAGISRS